MPFDTTSNMFGRSSATPAGSSMIDTLFVNGEPVGQIIISGSCGRNSATSANIAQLFEKVLKGEENINTIDLGFMTHYQLSEDGKVLDLRFIDPEEPSVSKTMVTASLEKGEFTHDIAQTVLKSFVLPEDVLPKFDPKDPKPSPV